MDTLRTGKLAKAVGISVQQVRNYEAWGFLPSAARSRAGYRLYAAMHLEALKAARCMIAGYGWQQALGILQVFHRGDLDTALALVDKRHAELDRQREQVERIVAALYTEVALPLPQATMRELCLLQIGEAAAHVGVRVSALRYWEQRGLLTPRRDGGSRYRLYDKREMRRVQVVALLRSAGYDFGSIRIVLDDLIAGRPERVLAAVEKRREELHRASRAGIEATVAFWHYASRYPPRALRAPADEGP